jgi:hypothetical protein
VQALLAYRRLKDVLAQSLTTTGVLGVPRDSGTDSPPCPPLALRARPSPARVAACRENPISVTDRGAVISTPAA